MHKPIGMLSISCTVLEMLLWRWLTRNELTYSIGFNRLVNTHNNWLCWNYKNDIRPCVLNIRMQHLWKNRMFDMQQFNLGGFFKGYNRKCSSRVQ
jgi:hypothetical protein